MNTKELIALLDTKKLPDYSLLASEETLCIYEDALEDLLSKAKKSFEILLTLPEKDISFENVVEEYFSQDELLSMLYSFLHHLNNTQSSETVQKLIRSFQPKMVEYQNMKTLSTPYYSLLKKVKENMLTPEQKRSLELLRRDMELSGVHLPQKKKQRLEEINTQLANLSEKFSENVLKSQETFYHHFPTNEDLQEIPEADMYSAQEEAKKREKKGWVFTLRIPSYQAILQYCPNQSIREKFWKANMQIATSGEHDNRPIIVETLQLRKEKASILGYKNYAEYMLKTRMAKNEEEIFSFLLNFAEKAKKKAKEEWEMLENFSQKKPLEYWDIAYHAEKWKQTSCHIDEKKFREYFPLSQALEGMLHVANTLFNVSFKKIHAPLYDKDVYTYEVFLGEKKISYFLFDFFSHEKKRNGAWCDFLRSKTKEEVPIVVNVMNFGKGTATTPPLLTHDNLETLFHEFGHGLHCILGKTLYANTNSFHTEWDFVELPSQLFENWTWEQEGLDSISQHFQKKTHIPQEMVLALQKTRTFLKGMFILRQNEFALLDFLLHTDEPPKTIDELEEKTSSIANTYSIKEKPESYKMYASFLHIFSGEYCAGYYSYLWAEVLEADVFSRFKKEGILNPKIGKEYSEKILEQGAKKDAKQLFYDFMKRDPHPEALLKKLGFL
jgi:peptidyl-dipeptidase Dcp